MLQNIKPNRKKSKDGGLTPEEKCLVKGLLQQGYIPQDIVHIVNQGRKQTTNLGRISKIDKNDEITAATDKEVKSYLKIQSSPLKQLIFGIAICWIAKRTSNRYGFIYMAS